MEESSKNGREWIRSGHAQPPLDEAAWKASEEILSLLPNDLTRLIYLTSIRDYNSGIYRHPQLSRQFDATVAHHVFEVSHRQVFARLLASPIRNYVEQLEGYIRYSRAERDLFLESWQSLKAYQAAIPAGIPNRASAAYFLNVESALMILERPQHGAS
jgi:hypothetical protein